MNDFVNTTVATLSGNGENPSQKLRISLRTLEGKGDPLVQSVNFKVEAQSGEVIYPRSHSFLGPAVPLLLNQPATHIITSVSVESLVSSGSAAVLKLVSPRALHKVNWNVKVLV